MPPKEWRDHLLGDVAIFKNGLNFTRSSDGEQIKIVGVSDFKNRAQLDDTEGLDVIRVSGKVRASELLESGDLLFVRSNGNRELIGRCLYFPQIKEKLAYSGFTIRGRVDSSTLDPLFASHLMRSSLIKNQIFLGGSGTNISNLSQEILTAVEISLPPIEEQRRIAMVLSIWDESIGTSESLLANIRKQKHALQSQALTGKRRLGAFSSIRAQQSTPHGPIPADWLYPRIESIAEEFSQRHDTDNQYPVLSCTKHAGLVESLTYFNKQVFSKDLSTYKVVPRGCFVYATNHIEEGSIGYQNLHDFGLVSPMYTVFRTDATIDDEYLYRLLKTEHFRQIFAAATNASVDRRGSLRWNDFKKLHVPLPSMEEQKGIADLLDTADQEISLLQKQLAFLRDEKSALMQQLLTGKSRLRMSETVEAEPA